MSTVPFRSPTSIGIAIGDPNGVGAEIALRAALALHATRGVRCMLIGEDFIVSHACDSLRLDSPQRAAFDVHSVGALARSDWAPGLVTAPAGAATVAYARAAVDLLRTGQIAAIAAGPHSETAVNAAGIAFTGYAGLLADLTGTPRDRVFLMLEAHGLRVVHVTLHQSVASALARLTPELVEAAAEAARSTLLRMGVPAPSLCVLGINPHAGENGLFGDEDERITRPAVERMRARGWVVEGPCGADLALSERRHDAHVATLHDQGHIPIKLLAPNAASALSIGGDALLSSVGHGSAMDIAGRGIADATALLRTIDLLSGAAQTRTTFG